MKKLILLPSCLILCVSIAQSQIEQAVQGITLPDLIGSIAEKADVPAVDYSQIASGTLQIAKISSEAGQRLPDSVVYDALDAVDAGREKDPNLTDWGKLEEDLQKLLEPPPEQQQQQQQGQDGQQGDQNQDQQNQDQGSDSQQGDSSQENSESQGDQQNQDQPGSESEQNSQGGQQGSENQQQSSDSQESSGDQGSEGEEQQMPPAKDGAQMGELQDQQQQQDIQLADDQQQSAPPEQMQTLGGQQSNSEPVNAENAAIMQMLEQLKQQDDPGKLFKILQDAQSDGKQNSQPNTKDW